MLGGTEFVGRAVVSDAVHRGWDVTVLNRGRRAAPDGVTALVGDRTRDDGLDVLADGRWDAVVDTWSAGAEVVERSAHFLAPRTSRYAYVSSRSVYAFPTPAGADESAPLVEPGTAGYPGDKRDAEIAVEAAFGAGALLARAGLILGPHENVGRLPWWLRRIAAGGRVLAPGPAEAKLQYVDARDLAAWLLDAIEANRSGPFDIVSRPGHTTMAGLLEACVTATGSTAELVWVDPAVVLAAGAAPWSDLPVWIPPGDTHDAMHGSDVAKALRTGLRCRPVTETVADTWAWLQALPGPPPQRPDRPAVGLDPAVEAKILEGVD